MRGVVIFFVLSICMTAWAETYKWVDEKGTVHFTQDYGSIPEKYRGQLEQRVEEPGVKPEMNQESQKVPKERSNKGLQKSSRKDRNEKQPASKDRIESDAAETLRTILFLWRDEKYEALYAYGIDANRVKMSREEFVKKMKKKSWGLASSWETVRDMETKFKSSTSVYVSARIGYKAKQGGTVKVQAETYQMRLDNGVWKTDLSKILQGPKK